MTKVVRIRVDGEPVEVEGPPYLPACPNDGGLVERLLDYMQEAGIHPALRERKTGGGRYYGFFFAEDAEKIKGWLLDQGAEESTEQ